jgi:RNA polymerase primary sigma factor
VELRRESAEEEVAKRLGWTVEEVRDVKDVMPDAMSLNQPLSQEDTASELGDFIKDDERDSDTADAVMRKMETSLLREDIRRLPERHRLVLVRRYGLDDQEPATLAELGEELDISRERVRQMQREAERIIGGKKYRRLAAEGRIGDSHVGLSSALCPLVEAKAETGKRNGV